MAKRKATSDRPIAVDLFSGAGGMSLGFEQAGFDIALAVDRDGHHVATHARNFPNGRVLCRAVDELTADDIFAAVGSRSVDLVFGGPPCQGFSTMGLRDVRDPRNGLVFDFARLIGAVQPRAFVMENVPGLLSGAGRPILDAVLDVLGEDYRIASPMTTLDASSFGVPERRSRLFVLGVRKDAGERPENPVGPARGQPPRPTVWQAIADLPSALTDNDRGDYDAPPASDYARALRGLERDPSDFSVPRRSPTAGVTGCRRVRHSAESVALYGATAPGAVVPGHKLPRLHPDGLCPTLRAGSDSTHGSYTAPRPIHPFEPRCITAREAARLHGYPDWFAFYPSKWHAYQQIGNSVCPPVARAVGRQILVALGEQPTRPRAALALTDEFPLPAERPRTLRRIPHVRHYPPVIAHLFAAGFDEAKGRLWRDRFTFADVEAAIAATGAKLPWVRPDNFLAELARSRRVREFLKPLTSRGYTLRAVRNGDFIGEFVPAGSPGAVDDKSEPSVLRSDIAGAIPVAFAANGSGDSLAYILKQRPVIESLWDAKGAAVELTAASDLFGGSAVTGYRLTRRRKPLRRGGIFVAANGSLPPLPRVRRLATAGRATELVALARLTTRHVVAALYVGCPESPSEFRRCVYELTEHGRPDAS